LAVITVTRKKDYWKLRSLLQGCVGQKRESDVWGSRIHSLPVRERGGGIRKILIRATSPHRDRRQKKGAEKTAEKKERAPLKRGRDQENNNANSYTSLKGNISVKKRGGPTKTWGCPCAEETISLMAILSNLNETEFP